MVERIIVFGGRAYANRAKVNEVMDRHYGAAKQIACGGAPGADALAWDWGQRRGFFVQRFFADWKTHGRAAGPIRNQEMLEVVEPTLVIAFAGGRGTADMIRRAKDAGVEVLEVSDA